MGYTLTMADVQNLKQLKVAVLGDKSVGKSGFIKNYIDLSEDKNVLQKSDYKRFTKNIKGNKFSIDIYEFNSKNDKIIPCIEQCHVIFLMFDLNNRNSFDNLSDYWLNFLRDDVIYENNIYILGNYNNSSQTPLTQNEEITAMIKFSHVKANYIETGNKSPEELSIMMDELVQETYENDKKSNKSCGDKGGSMKHCVIC